MRYSKDELSALVQTELRKSLGAPDSEISSLRLRNLQYFKAEPVGELAPPEAPDRSQVVATDVPDTVEWMLPALVGVFARSPDSMECAARRPQFAEGAKLASEYLRHCFWTRNEGFTILYQWFKDALVQKVGFVKVYWDKTTEDVEESYTGLLPEQVQGMLASGDVQVLEQTARTETLSDGQPVEVYDLRVKRTESEGRCVVQPVPPEEMRIHRRARYGEDPLFVAHVSSRTKGELESEGYDLTDADSGASALSTEAIERADSQEFSLGDDSDGELMLYEVSECYIRLDQDNDGVPEWRRVLLIGSTVMEDEKVDSHPFVWFCPNPLPHVFFGQCPADHAIEPAKLNTSLLRGLMDNVYLSVNQRMQVLDGQVNLDDLTNSRPGGLVRVREMGAVQPLVQPGLDQGAWQMVEWGEQWRERRTGFTRYSQGMSPDALNPTATGVNIITEKADQRTELIARVAAESVRTMFGKMLKCMGQYQDVSDVVELMGQWVSVDPREWADGYRIEVNVGLGTGSKDKRAAALREVYGMQQPLAASGALPPQALIATARGFAEAVGLGDPEQYFPDAQPPKPPVPPPQVQVEQMKLQADAQKYQAETQRDAAEADKQRAHELQLAQVNNGAKLQSELLSLSAGVLASRTGAVGPNIINGTVLDQSGAAMTNADPAQLDQVVAEINRVAQAFVQRPVPPMGGA